MLSRAYKSGPPLTAVTAVTPAAKRLFSRGSASGWDAQSELAFRSALPQSLFDSRAFSQPALYKFGNEGVGIICGSGWINVDVSLMPGLRSERTHLLTDSRRVL